MRFKTSLLAAAITSAFGLVSSINANAFDVRQSPTACQISGSYGSIGGGRFNRVNELENVDETLVTRVLCPVPQSSNMQADQIRQIWVFGYDQSSVEYTGQVSASLTVNYVGGIGGKYGKFGSSGGGNANYIGAFNFSLGQPTGLTPADRNNFVSIEVFIPSAMPVAATSVGQSSLRGIIYSTL